MSSLLLAAPAYPYEVTGDAILRPLSAGPADAGRGRAIVASRQSGLCLLCHAAPIAEVALQGDLAPNLAGIGSRLSAGQLRLRLVEPRRLTPASIMPSFYRTKGLREVAPAYAGKPILSAGEIEDVIAYLQDLR